MTKTNYKLLSKKLSILEFAFGSANACYYAYIVMYLSYKGYKSDAIGTVMSITAIISIISPPIWGYVSDKIKAINKVMIICALLTTLSIIILPFLDALSAVTIFMIVIAFTDSPNSPLLDSLVIQNTPYMADTSYGNIRLWGSVGYALIAYFIGLLIKKYNIEIIFMAYALFALCMIIILISLSDKNIFIIKKDNNENRTQKQNVRLLLTDKDFVSFLIFAFLLFVPSQASTTFLPILFNVIHGDSAQLGIAWFVAASSEVPVLFFGRRLYARYKPTGLILMSSVFFVIRLIIYSFTYSSWLAILNQTLQGMSYALFLTGAVYYINEIAPDNLKATAQTLTTAAYMGASGILGNYLGGIIIENFNIYVMYKLGIILQLIAILWFLTFTVLKNKKSGLVKRGKS